MLRKPERLGGWKKGKNQRANEKHSVDKSRTGMKGDRECETESNREEDTHRREGEKQRGEKGVCGSRGSVEQEKTTALWEHSYRLSKAPLCSQCWSVSQN